MKEEVIKRVAIPTGWITVSELEKQKELLQENKEEYVALKYFSEAATTAEKIIQAVTANTDIAVPEAYMKLSDDVFHLLLLIKDKDYHLPVISRARYLANNTTQQLEFDMHVLFSSFSEYHRKRILFPDDYTLMHV